MPIYRYKCKSCNEEFTALTSIDKENEVRCERCGSSEVEKLLPRSFVGRTSGGKIAGGECSACTASSCRTCRGR